MKFHRRTRWMFSLFSGGFAVIALLTCAMTAVADEQQSPIPGLSQREALHLGERMYREGILPSGEPINAIVQDDIPILGTMFTCTSCHLRSGLGSYEGGVITTPTTGNILYRPLFNGSELLPVERTKFPQYFQAPERRPAYTDDTLADVLKFGIDPTGRKLNPVMPRYDISGRDMSILIFYLKSLSAELSPGVTAATIRFATIVSDEVRPEDRKAMLMPLQAYFKDRNSQAKTFETRRRYGAQAEAMDLSFRRPLLSVWELKGPPETWRRQLEAFYQREPVFAILGGITTGEWKPIHEFCEEHHLPSIFPITDFPVISETDWYTLYFSKGLYQEGEAVARYLRRTELTTEDKVIQVYSDTPEGNALARGFEETWHALGRRPPTSRVLHKGEALTSGLIQQLQDKGKPSALLLWGGSETLPILETVSGMPDRPRMVFVSSSLLKQNLWTLPDTVRNITYITYPYRLPQEEGAYSNTAKVWLQWRKIPVDDQRISTKMYSLMQLMTLTFMHMKRYFYRDYFLDVIGMFQDQQWNDYERFSFGPGQRYASKGCYIVQITNGLKPVLMKKSEWVIH